MANSPFIEKHFALLVVSKRGGIRDPRTPPVAPALANAIFAATGRRLRDAPLQAELSKRYRA
jgi:isoquinoline 1-oxidoreductase subunit beta